MAFNGRTALITGASRGLGKAMALSLAEAGARVALVARDVAQLNAVADQARGLGVQAEVFRTDISDESQVRQLFGLRRDEPLTENYPISEAQRSAIEAAIITALSTCSSPARPAPRDTFRSGRPRTKRQG